MTKLNKKTINTFSNVEVMAHFERVTIKLTKEANRVKGETKQTLKEYEILKEELLNRLSSTKTYDSNFQIMDR